MELFGYYFPPEILNWYCDDWINLVYKMMNTYYPLMNHECWNIGGSPRYVINNNMRYKYKTIASRDVKRAMRKL
jgi:hypothetical protein